MASTFGERIRELREAADLSLRELGDKIGKTPPFLSDIELGHRYPSEDVLKPLAKALGTTVEDLKKYDHRPPTKEIAALFERNEKYGLAFRTVVETVKKERLSPAELMRRVQQESSGGKEGST